MYLEIFLYFLYFLFLELETFFLFGIIIYFNNIIFQFLYHINQLLDILKYYR